MQTCLDDSLNKCKGSWFLMTEQTLMISLIIVQKDKTIVDRSGKETNVLVHKLRGIGSTLYYTKTCGNKTLYINVVLFSLVSFSLRITSFKLVQ